MRSYLESQLGFDSETRSRTKRRLLATYGPYISEFDNARVLEIGPGRGELIELLLDRSYIKSVEAVDLDQGVVQKLNEYFDREVVIRVDDTEKFLREGNREYDLIFMTHVLEHVAHVDTVPLLKAIEQALSDRGVFICEVPNCANIFVGGAIYASDFTHRVMYTSESLRQVMDMAGFGDVTISPVVPVVRGPVSAVQSALRRVLDLVQLSVTKVYAPSLQLLRSTAIYSTCRKSR